MFLNVPFSQLRGSALNVSNHLMKIQSYNIFCFYDSLKLKSSEPISSSIASSPMHTSKVMECSEVIYNWKNTNYHSPFSTMDCLGSIMAHPTTPHILYSIRQETTNANYFSSWEISVNQPFAPTLLLGLIYNWKKFLWVPCSYTLGQSF